MSQQLAESKQEQLQGGGRRASMLLHVETATAHVDQQFLKHAAGKEAEHSIIGHKWQLTARSRST